MARLGKSDFVEGERMSEIAAIKTLKKYTKAEAEEILVGVISDLSDMQIIRDSGIGIKVWRKPDKNGIFIEVMKGNLYQVKDFDLK